MRVQVDGVVRTGRSVELTGFDVDGRDVVRAIRDDGKPLEAVSVDCPAPGSVHEYVGHVHAGMSVPVRAALAAVARQRGLSAPQDDDLAAARRELTSLSVPDVDLSGAHERVGSLNRETVERLREEVAARRGALQARRALDEDPESTREQYREVAGRLADLETDRVAAEQELARARERARKARDVRERRLELQDRVGNLERAAREHLAGELAGPFAAAVDAVPGDGVVPGEPGSFEGEAVTGALAIARLASVRAPVVLDADVFATARAASRVLDAPVVRV